MSKYSLVGDKMNKTKAIITVILALISVLVLFSVARTEDPFTYATASQEEQTEPESTEPTGELVEEELIEEEIVEEDDPSPRAEFIDEDYSRYKKSKSPS